jgi:putative salt-induced outer membrane protein
MPSTRFTSPTSTGHSAVGLFLLCLTTAVTAQTQADGLWHGSLSIGGSSSSGTTSATSLNLRAESSKVTDADKISLNALVNYGRSKTDGVTTRSADLARAGGRYDRNLNERLFAFSGAEGEVNRPDGVSSRLSVNVGAGWHVLRGETTNWDVFTGVGHTETKFTDDSSRRGAEALLGEESSHKLGSSSTFKQRLVLYPGVDAIGQRATFDASLATAIVGSWTFNAGLGLRYASEVAPGSKQTERLLTFGFGYKF